MRLFDLYFNYTPSDLSPLHFLSNMNLESKYTLTFPISPVSRIAKKIFHFFTFLWFTCDLWRFKENSFPPSWRAREGLPMTGETARLCNHPWSTAAPWHPAFSLSLQLSWKGSYFMSHFVLQALVLSNRLIVLLECWKYNFKNLNKTLLPQQEGKMLQAPEIGIFVILTLLSSWQVAACLVGPHAYSSS